MLTGPPPKSPTPVPVDSPEPAPPPVPPTDAEVVITEEKREGFYIARSIAAQEVDRERISYRDHRTYFSIQLDDNKYKPILRLYLNGVNVKRVETFEHGRDGTPRDIESVSDICKVAAEPIRQVIRQYEQE